ncbi:MAG TPA: outer membrane beta-barrel protein [Acidobacteriaceae bacterium]|nr:outer membrane beta-barrel protein [Acidobacteriaceae bacterium]
MKWIPRAMVFALAACAASASGQTSVGLSVYGAFSGTTTGNGTAQSPANQAGGLIELRHIANPIFGFEATYSFNRADQTYKTDLNDALCPAPGCSLGTEPVPANAHEFTADWVPSLRVGNLRPFGVLGAGALVDVPAESQATITYTSPCGVNFCPAGPLTLSSPTSTSVEAVYVYGAGLDWGLLPHLGLRLQYRGNLYHAPDVSQAFSSTDSFMHTAEPMIGAYFSF